MYTHSRPDPHERNACIRRSLGTWFPSHSLPDWLCDIWQSVHLSGLLLHLELRELNLPIPKVPSGLFLSTLSVPCGVIWPQQEKRQNRGGTDSDRGTKSKETRKIYSALTSPDTTLPQWLALLSRTSGSPRPRLTERMRRGDPWGNRSITAPSPAGGHPRRASPLPQVWQVWLPRSLPAPMSFEHLARR